MNFAVEINRKHTNCEKWDGQGKDYIPLWVADMDFPVAEPIREALARRLEHPVFGYTFPGEEIYDAILRYYRERYRYEIKKEWIVFVQGVNVGNNIAARALGGTIMVATPMYPHINRGLPAEAGKPIIRVPLKEQDGSFTFDFDKMQQAINDQVTTFVLCNPHNPVGRVYTKKELEQLLDFAVKNRIVIVSDEIHSDLILEGQHIPAFTIREDAWKYVIVHHSATKTYNIPGLPVAFAIIPNEEIRERYKREAYRIKAPIGTLSYTALEAAFTKGEPWRQELLAYLRENKRFLDQRVEAIDGLHIYPSQATYLGWIDARETGLANPWEFFREKAGVNFNDGAPFSAEGFVRVNFGCCRSLLEKAFDKVERALKER